MDYIFIVKYNYQKKFKDILIKHTLFKIYSNDWLYLSVGFKMILAGKLWSTIFYIALDDVLTQLELDGLY